MAVLQFGAVIALTVLLGMCVLMTCAFGTDWERTSVVLEFSICKI